MMTQFLAETAGLALDPITVGTIIGGVITALVGGGLIGKRTGKAEGKAEAMQIGPQPFMVELKEAFVTRREFDRLEGVVAVNASRVEGMFRETMKEVKDLHSATAKTITKQGEKLSQDIRDVATGAYNGRQKIHQTVNSNAERLAKVEQRIETTTELKAVAESICEAIQSKH